MIFGNKKWVYGLFFSDFVGKISCENSRNKTNERSRVNLCLCFVNLYANRFCLIGSVVQVVRLGSEEGDFYFFLKLRGMCFIFSSLRWERIKVGVKISLIVMLSEVETSIGIPRQARNDKRLSF